MGRLGKILAFSRGVRAAAQAALIKINFGGNVNLTAEQFSAAGDDSAPLETDIPLAVQITGTGRYAVIGYADPDNAGVTSPGEKRIYGRDANGTVVSSVYLDNAGAVTVETDAATLTVLADGTIQGTGPVGSFELQVGGDMVCNGSLLKPGGIIVCTSLQLGGGALTMTTAGGNLVSSGGFASSDGTTLDGHTHDFTYNPGPGSPTNSTTTVASAS